MDAKALKDRITEVRRDRRREPVVMQSVEQRQALSTSMTATGRELRMSSNTLSSRRARHAGSSSTSLARVTVVVAERSDQVVVVHGPGGFRFGSAPIAPRN